MKFVAYTIIRHATIKPHFALLSYQNNIHKGRLLYIKAANTEYIFYSPQESKNLSTKSKKFDFKSPFFVREIQKKLLLFCCTLYRSTPIENVKNTSKLLLTLALWAFIIKVAFEHKCCTKAKNKNRIQKIYNSTLHIKNRLYSQLPVLFLV